MRLKLAFLLIMPLFIYSCDWNKHAKFQGYIEGENIYLASPYGGTLEKLAVVRGQHVNKGQLIFSLDPNPQQINIASIQGELQQAENTLADLKKPRRLPEIEAIQAQIEQTNAEIQLAQIRVQRQQKLLSKQATDKDTLDAAVANFQQQQQLKNQYEANLALAKLGSREDQIKAQNAQVDSLKAKLDEALWESTQKTLYAPDNGVIFDTYYRVGEYVANQQPVASLLTPKNIRLEFYVPLEYSSTLKVGQPITFDCEGCAKNNQAVINYISPDAEYLPPLVYSRENYSKLVFRIKASIPHSTQFKPGQPVVVTL